MLKVRVIPVLFLMNGLIVRSERFREFKVIGNPVSELERYSEWLADELVYIDITREGGYDLRRDDHKVKGGGDLMAILHAVAAAAFMPLTFGGRIRSLEAVDAVLHNGADKVLITSAAWHDPGLIERAAGKYGSQAVTAGIDLLRGDDGALRVTVDQGRTVTDAAPAAWARRLQDLGAGEILVNTVHRDGTAAGFDVPAVRAVAEAVGVPVIACGGAGQPRHFLEALADGGADAVAAGNIFHFTENAYRRVKRQLRDAGVDVRFPYAF